MYIRAANGFLVVYSITDRQSFEDLEECRERILKVKEEMQFPMVLVGNKCDLDSKREVSTLEGQV
jgi:GTPase SAR1 family protein